MHPEELAYKLRQSVKERIVCIALQGSTAHHSRRWSVRRCGFRRNRHDITTTTSAITNPNNHKLHSHNAYGLFFQTNALATNLAPHPRHPGLFTRPQELAPRLPACSQHLCPVSIDRRNSLAPVLVPHPASRIRIIIRPHARQPRPHSLLRPAHDARHRSGFHQLHPLADHIASDRRVLH